MFSAFLLLIRMLVCRSALISTNYPESSSTTANALEAAITLQHVASKIPRRMPEQVQLVL
jgi:hypothetical protein